MAAGLTSARIAALVQRVEVRTQQAIITTTRRLVAENESAIARTFGRPPGITQAVDGIVGKPLETIDPRGYTDTRFEVAASIITEAFTALVRASPFGPAEGGHYRDDHWMFVNGIRRDATLEGKEIVVGRGDRIVFVNVRPYARKIEGGARTRTRRFTDRRPGLSVQAPDGVYEITARDLRRRFGNLANITFTYLGVVDGAPVDPPPAASRRPGRAPHNRPANRYPSIQIEIL